MPDQVAPTALRGRGEFPRHRAREEPHHAEMRRAERGRVQDLQRRQHRRRRIERHRGPADDRAQAADRQQRGRAERLRQPPRERKQHDLGRDAEPPQHADHRAVEAAGAPIHGREAVVERVAALDHARRQHHGEKRRVAQQNLRRLDRRRRRDRAGTDLDRVERSSPPPRRASARTRSARSDGRARSPPG